MSIDPVIDHRRKNGCEQVENKAQYITWSFDDADFQWNGNMFDGLYLIRQIIGIFASQVPYSTYSHLP